ncbi:hypothetical protein TYRP_014730 [Tyrophagus putrescentiae]|nr:hypothetical protein TYRP_014730 [Tyrophagus putrescentiae]
MATSSSALINSNHSTPLPSAYSPDCYIPPDHANVNSEPLRWLVMLGYGATAAVALFLNVSNIVARGWWNRSRQGLRPFFIMLSIGEALLALTLPLAMQNFLNMEWPGGSVALCRLVQMTSLGATFFVRSMHIVAATDRLLNFRYRRTWFLGHMARLFHKNPEVVLYTISVLTVLYLIMPWQTAGLATGEGPPPERRPFRYCTVDCRRWKSEGQERLISEAFAVVNFIATAVTIYAITVPTDLLVTLELKRAEEMVVGNICKGARHRSTSSRTSSIRRAAAAMAAAVIPGRGSRASAEDPLPPDNAHNRRLNKQIREKRRGFKAATQMIYWLLITDLALWTPAKVYQLFSAFRLISWCSEAERSFTIWLYIAVHYLSLLSTVATPLLQLYMSANLRKSFRLCWKSWYECCTHRSWPWPEGSQDSAIMRANRQEAVQIIYARRRVHAAAAAARQAQNAGNPQAVSFGWSSACR